MILALNRTQISENKIIFILLLLFFQFSKKKFKKLILKIKKQAKYL